MPKQKRTITKMEQRYVLYGMFIIYLWFGYIKNLIVPTLSTMYIPLASFVYDMGLLYGLYLIAKPLGGKTAQTCSCVGYLVWISLDLLTPPYLVSAEGVLNKGVELWFVSKDASVYTILQNIGVATEHLYTYTYMVVPIILMFIIPVWLSKEKEIRSYLKL